MNGFALPPNFSVKQHCWNIFNMYYTPGQAKLIEPCMQMEPKPPTDTNSSVPNWHPDFPKRLCILLGIGSVDNLIRISKDPIVTKEVRQFLVVEEDPEVVAHLINSKDFLQFMMSQHFRFIFCSGKDNMKSLLFSVLKQPDYSTIMQCGQLFVSEHAKPKHAEVYKYFTEIYDETVFHVYHNYGRIDDSLEGIRATLKNKDYIFDNPGITELKDSAVGYTAAVVGAGPSLDKDLPVLKANREKFIIYCADASVKPLLAAGITPDFTTSIERGNIYQRPFWEKLPPIDTELVFFPVVHPEVLSIYPGPKRVVYRNYSYYGYFQNAWPKGVLACGGSTTQLSLRLAAFMGCSRYVLIGVDNAYEKQEDGLYRSHAHNVGHEQWASTHPLDYFVDQKAHAFQHEVEACDGTKVMTNVTYHQWSKEFNEEIFSQGLLGKINMTAEKGLRIPAAPYRPLEEICQEIAVPETPYEKPVSKPFMYRNWEHKHLRKSIRGWTEYADLLLEVIEAAKALPPDRAVPSSLFQFLQHKFVHDDMFVSFVVQNCAAEYYQLENRWNAFPNDLLEKYPERLAFMQTKLKLYKQVLEKLTKIFEEEDGSDNE